MGRSRVILADTDENYISRLEMKFLEELQDDIDLEIITDIYYFQQLFLDQQTAEILVIGERMYFEDIWKKHNIRNIVILSEMAEESCPLKQGLTSIYKYSNRNDIYSQVMAVGGADIILEASKPKETQVILLYSPTGGVGKTTLALGICACMTQTFKRVLYINAEHMNNFQQWTQNVENLPNHACMVFQRSGDQLYQKVKPWIRKEKFDYLPGFGAPLSSLQLPFSVYEQLIRAVKSAKDYDVIVVDTDSYLDDEKSSLIALADKVLLIHTQTSASVFGMEQLIRNVNVKDSEKFFFICNRVDAGETAALRSSGKKTEFIVDEYVGYIQYMESLNLNHLGKQTDIQKIAALLY